MGSLNLLRKILFNSVNLETELRNVCISLYLALWFVKWLIYSKKRNICLSAVWILVYKLILFETLGDFSTFFLNVFFSIKCLFPWGVCSPITLLLYGPGNHVAIQKKCVPFTRLEKYLQYYIFNPKWLLFLKRKRKKVCLQK